jgi:hypothetical protein
VSNGTKRTAVVESIDTLRSIFDDQEVILLGNGHNALHGTGNTSIMHWKDGFCPGSDRRLDQTLVEVQGVGPNVNEYRSCTQPNKSIRRGNERE